MDQAVNTLFQLNEYAEVSEVAHFCSVLRANRIFLLDVCPRVSLELLDAERHFALFAVECKNYCLYLVAHLHEVLSRTQVL